MLNGELDKVIENINNLLDDNSKEKFYFSIELKLLIKKLFCVKRLSLKEKFYMRLYEKSQDYIDNHMDVINYLSLIKEFTYVKSLLFDHVHALCLRFAKNPKLYENSQLTKLNKDNYDMIEEIVKFYTNNPNLSEKDMKFHELLPDNFKEFIENYKS